MEAAARLGVGVFASAPLLEGQLLQDSDLQVIPSDLISRHLRGQLLLLMQLNVPFGASLDVVKIRIRQKCLQHHSRSFCRL